MKLYIDDSLKYFTEYTEHIKDHASSWKCLTFSFTPEIHEKVDIRNIITTFMKKAFADHDTAIFWLPSGDVFVLFQNLLKPIRDSFYRFSASIATFIDDEPKETVLDLGVEWDVFSSHILAQKTYILEKSKREKAEKEQTFKTPQISRNIVEQHQKIRTQRHYPLLMIVEDDRFTQQLIATGLKSHCEIITADDVHRAAFLYQQRLPDMVLMDIELPDGNGAKLMEAICDADDDAFIVMLSAHSMKNQVLSCLHEGAKGFIAKPFKRGRLMHYLNAWHEFKDERRVS